VDGTYTRIYSLPLPSVNWLAALALLAVDICVYCSNGWLNTNNSIPGIASSFSRGTDGLEQTIVFASSAQKLLMYLKRYHCLL